MEQIWQTVFYQPILNLLIFFYQIFSFIRLPGAFGFAIVALTVVVRFITMPLSAAQLKSAKKMQSLKPKIDALSQKYKNDKTKLQQAQMELYKSAGVNPAAGCLPLLIQFPVFIALYNVFIKVITAGTDGNLVSGINSLLYHPILHVVRIDLWFFGLNLASKPNEWQKYGVGMLLIPVITGGLQYIQTKLMIPPESPKTDKSKTPAPPDQMADMQKQMGLIMPVMIGFFALSFPIGLSIYWNIFTLFGIIQQISINKNK